MQIDMSVIHMNVTGKSTSTYSLVLHFSLCTGLTECNPSRVLHVKFHTAQADTCWLFFLLLQGGPALFVTSSHTLALLQSQAVFCQFHHFDWKYGVKHIRDQSKHSSCIGNSLPFGKSTKTSAFIKAGVKTFRSYRKFLWSSKHYTSNWSSFRHTACKIT